MQQPPSVITDAHLPRYLRQTASSSREGEPAAEIDFETASAVGFVWNAARGKWDGPPGAPQNKKGLPVVGSAVYAEHPSTRVLTLSWKLPGDPTVTRWRPGLRACRVVHRSREPFNALIDRTTEWGNPFKIGPDGDRAAVIAKYKTWIIAQPTLMAKVRYLAGKTLGCWCAPDNCHGEVLSELAALPWRLFDWIAAGGRVRAHNVMFERLIWTLVCERLYGFPPLIPENLDCTMATARVNTLPGGLENLGDVLQLPVRKSAEGRRVLNKFSIPRTPTKTDARVWITPDEDPADAEVLYSYCDTDVLTEEAAGEAMPPMTSAEREFWLIDQEINWRGLGVDRPAIRDCISILNQTLARYGEEMRALTGGIETTQLEQLKGWLAAQHVYVDSLDAESIESILSRLAPHPPGGIFPARRVIELRALTGSASVKKLFAMENMASADNRLRNLIVHHGARTGRPTGEGAQPLNMPRSGPKLVTCAPCGRPYKPEHDACPWCGAVKSADARKAWKPEMVDHALEIIATRSLDLVEYFFGDALLTIAGCSRGLFVAGDGMELIASDYSAIEAVVTAELAQETWRQDAFRNQEPIYLVSASKITGKSVQEYLAYFELNGEHHADRQNIGKVAELGLGFGGWINAWLAFDDSGTFNEYEIKDLIKAWRAASPNIVELWGGQWRGAPWNGYAERFGFEGAAINAVQYPDVDFRPMMRQPDTGEWWNGPDVTFRYDSRQDALLVTLPCRIRNLTYWQPRLAPSTREYASAGELSLTYMTWNSNPKYGVIGWVRMNTFGGRLTENIVQATAHDLLRYAIINARSAGLPVVLHVYDELIVEVPAKPRMLPGLADPWVAELETIMSTVPAWAAGWPIRASGGWRGRRYRKG